VTAVKAGTCTVTAASSDGLITATCNITINAPPAPKTAVSSSSQSTTSSSSTPKPAPSPKPAQTTPAAPVTQWNTQNNPSTPEPAKDFVSETDLASNGYWKYDVMSVYWQFMERNVNGVPDPNIADGVWAPGGSTTNHLTNDQSGEIYCDITRFWPAPTSPGTSIGQKTETKWFSVYLGEGHN
jgi:hypothetical protein